MVIGIIHLARLSFIKNWVIMNFQLKIVKQTRMVVNTFQYLYYRIMVSLKLTLLQLTLSLFIIWSTNKNWFDNFFFINLLAKNKCCHHQSSSLFFFVQSFASHADNCFSTFASLILKVLNLK